MTFLSSRFLLLPDVTKVAKQVLEKKRGDIFRRFTNSEELEFNFIRFLEFINRIRNSSAQSFKPIGSNIFSYEGGSRPGTPVQPASNADSSSGSGVLFFSTDVDGVLQAWSAHLQRHPLQPLSKSALPLPQNVFLSYDFIYWLMRNVNDLDVLEEAFSFANRLVG